MGEKGPSRTQGTLAQRPPVGGTEHPLTVPRRAARGGSPGVVPATCRENAKHYSVTLVNKRHFTFPFD